ncbi:uncharacterized protein [Rutidosis leptorrhynchoides]|uniref:uncharacterized protein n=1 Tax=Rutidosis leptorrhynchoides TaxID=125765 RepID=UPI003A99CA89
MAEAELELEAMKMDDCSWHPCQVYFSPNGASLVIQYESDGSQDILVSEKEARMRIRARSLPLQENGCTQIKPGEHVAVNQNSESDTVLFDAEVEKVLKVRHSKRMDCRCSFMIRWLHQDLNGGSLTVPSTSIMRLADKSIDKHPTISAFIDANASLTSMSPELNVVDDFDLNLQNLLEKQIEGIKNSVHCSKKRIRDEINGLEANVHEQENETEISLTNVKEQEIKFSAGSPLNPLAARAALASLMSKPQSIEISTGIDNISTTKKQFLKTEPVPKPVRNAKKSLFVTNDSSDVVEVSKAVEMTPEITPWSTRAKSKTVNRNIPSTVNNRRVTRSVLNQEESAGDELCTERRNKTRNKEGKSLLSTNDSSDMSPDVDISPNQSGKGHAKEDEMNTEITPGLTRAKYKKVEEKIEKSYCVENKKSSAVSNRRFTRSVIHQDAASVKTETKKESGGEKLHTERRSKKRNTEDDGGSSYGNKKKSPDLTKHNKVLRSSPRFNSKS